MDRWFARRVRPRTPPGGKPVPAPTDGSPQLLPATVIVARLNDSGGTPEAALRLTLQQLAGLRAEVDDDARWERLRELVRRAADPWNADDWPLGFEPLLCCIPLCTRVAYECARCPVGKRQGGMSCAHPRSAFGTIWELIRDGERAALLEHVTTLQSSLDAASVPVL